MNPLTPPSGRHGVSSSTSKEDDAEPLPGTSWQGEDLTPAQRHELVTNADNDLTPAQRAALANEGLKLMNQSAEKAAAPPAGTPAVPALAPTGVGIWDLGAVLTGVLAGGALGGIGVLFGAQGHPEMASLLAETVIPASAVVGAVIAELTYRNCPC